MLLGLGEFYLKIPKSEQPSKTITSCQVPAARSRPLPRWCAITELYVQGDCGILITGVVPHAKASSEVILRNVEVRCVMAERQAEGILQCVWAA